jgi:hypothetical protein
MDFIFKRRKILSMYMRTILSILWSQVGTILLLLGSFNLFGQRDVVAAGGDISVAAGSVSFTVGQSFAAEIGSAAGTILQGVQQPYELFLVDVSDPDLLWDLEVYPNPVTHTLILRPGKDLGSEGFRFALTDLQGRNLASDRIAGPEHILSAAEWAPGTYFLTVFRDQNTYKTFKIIKL